MGKYGKQSRAEEKKGKEADAVAELKGKMALGGVMSGRKAAKAVKAIKEGRG